MEAVPFDVTRDRLIEAAGHVFALRGFQAATVREICALAEANVASVNYHFRDKTGLFLAVLRQFMKSELPLKASDETENGQSPEGALRALIARVLERMCGEGEREGWHVRMMMHELAQPSEVLDSVVADVIGPNYSALREILSRILGLPPDHETTRLCAHSVIGQVVHYAHSKPVISRLWPELKYTTERLAQIAAHISEFSLCSLNAFANRKGGTV